jgi:hypothetical protein
MDIGPAYTESGQLVQRWDSKNNAITTENPVANIITSNIMFSPMSGLVNRWSINDSISPLFVRIPFSVILEIPSKFGVKLGRDRAER